MSFREKIIVLIFVIMTGSVVMINPFKGEKKLPAPNPAAVSSPSSSGKPAVVSSQEIESFVDNLEQSQQDGKVDNLTNPFQKFDLKVSGKTDMEYTDLVLTGIMMGREPVAVINNQILKAGDKISNFEIQAIDSNEVVIVRGVEKYVLKLFLDQ